MNDMIESLSLYNDVPLFTRVANLYNEELHMPLVDYSYELEQLQKEIEQLENKTDADIDRVIRMAKEGISSSLYTAMCTIIRELVNNNTKNFEEYFKRAMGDASIHKDTILSGYTILGVSLRVCSESKPPRYDILKYVIDNIMSVILAENPLPWNSTCTFYDDLLLFAIRWSNYDCVLWLLNTYNITWSSLHVMTHNSIARLMDTTDYSYEEYNTIIETITQNQEHS